MAQVEIRKARGGRRIERFESDVDPDDAAAAVALLKRWARQARWDVSEVVIAIDSRKGWREYRA